MTNKKVSVIIPNYNGSDLLGPCLESVENQGYADFEIIVVDDASTDDSLEILGSYPVRTFVNKENLGFSGTVNAGIRKACGDYVLLLNNDVVLEPGFIEALVERIESSGDVFSVSSKMLRYYEPETIDDTGDMYTVFGWVYKRGDGDPATAYSRADSVFSACAGAALYRRETIEELGYFDEMHESYLEDVDLGWRARIYGYRNLYEPKALCYHIGSATLAAGERYSDKKVSLSARNNVYIVIKNMPLGQILINLPTLLLGFTVKYFYFRRRGYGAHYLRGLSEGLRNISSLKRVPYESKRFKNYLCIQAEMLVSSVGYTLKKAAGFLQRSVSKILEHRRGEYVR